jgi:endoglucanase
MRPSPPPALTIVGGELRNGNGERVVLRGVAVRGVEIDDQAFVGTRFEQKRYSRADIQELAQQWGVNIIRVPIQPPAWAGDPEYSERNLDALVQWGAELGIYIFLGWHAHGNPITGEVEQPRQGPVTNERNHYNPDLELAKEALGELAERYRESPWVLYGAFNEPSHITWREWRPIAEELVDVIHEVHPDALVFVSGVDWGYDLSGAIDDPVERPNVIYETHPYPGKGDGWKTVLDKLRKVAPVFIGEWGFTPGSSEENLRGTAESYGEPLVSYAAERDIGWTAWWWHPAGDVSLLASWESYQPTALGQLVMDTLVTE